MMRATTLGRVRLFLRQHEFDVVISVRNLQIYPGEYGPRRTSPPSLLEPKDLRIKLVLGIQLRYHQANVSHVLRDACIAHVPAIRGYRLSSGQVLHHLHLVPLWIGNVKAEISNPRSIRVLRHRHSLRCKISSQRLDVVGLERDMTQPVRVSLLLWIQLNILVVVDLEEGHDRRAVGTLQGIRLLIAEKAPIE